MFIKNSFSGKNWRLAEFDERQTLLISQRYKLDKIISKLIAIRNINVEDISSFLSPDIGKILPDPYILKDMKKSVNRIYKSIINKEKIGIITDYDVDGASSAALLIKFLNKINVKTLVKIPDRLNEGYGPNKRIIDEFKKQEIDLIIALDCGTTSFSVFNKKILGNIDVIVVDHHISELNHPDVYGLINPNRLDENNDLKNLAAVGVTFLLLIALRRELRNNDFYNLNKFNEHNLTIYLDLVAVGTACDVVNLTHLNRAYVSKGLEILQKRNNKGLASLVDITNINHIPNVFDLSYIIGPRLNAGSRIGNPELATKILSSNDQIEIESISRKLYLLNEKRKLIENEMLLEAKKQALKKINKKIIIVHSSSWHPGVLGIVASRLLEEFRKPTIVISKKDKEGVGSGRSIPEINLGSLIIAAKNDGIIINGGGHKAAVGFKINNNKIDELSNFLETKINIKINQLDKVSFLYDSILTIEQINENLLSNLELLEPFGKGNKEPKFLILNLNINFIKTIKEKHLLISFYNSIGNSIEGICFNVMNTILGENLLSSKNKNLNIIASIKRNNFSNNSSAQLIIDDAIFA